VPKRLLVIGGGYIGLELGIFYREDRQRRDRSSRCCRDPARHRVRLRAGRREVAAEARHRGRSRTRRRSGTRRRAARSSSPSRRRAEGGLEVDQILSTVGRRPNSENLGLETDRVKPDAKGSSRSTRTAHERSRTSTRSATSPASRCSPTRRAARGSSPAAAIAGDKSAAFDPVGIPAVIFTDPEVASVGLTEPQAVEKGYTPVIGRSRSPRRAAR
jgi:dihydrolipoamide dehydrogenase